MNIIDIAVSATFANDQYVFVTTEEGLSRSTDGTLTWSLVLSSYANSIAISPNFNSDETVYVGTDVGVARSTDKGENWSMGSTGLPLNEAMRELTLPSDYSFGTGKAVFGIDQDLYRSLDDGLTWTKVALAGMQFGIVNIALSPDYSTSGVMWAGNSVELCLSEDFGATCQLVDYGESWPIPIALSPEYPVDQHMMVGGAGTMFFRFSYDAGDTWTTVQQGQTTALAFSPDYARDHLMIAGADNSNYGILLSWDRGATWHEYREGLGDNGINVFGISSGFAEDHTLFVANNMAGVQRRILPRLVALAESVSVVTGQRISTVTFTASHTIPDGTSIWYWLSADGGEHWEPEGGIEASQAASGFAHTFLLAGEELRWRAELHSNNPAVTPSVDQIHIVP